MTLRKLAILGMGLVAFGIGSVSAPSDADAAVCRARMSGQGTGQGIMGQGSTVARQAALADWASKVSAKHGARFANTAKARAINYDCKSGAIMQAKCVVTAIPCR